MTSPHALAPLLAAIGLPAPISAQPWGRPRDTRSTLLRFDGESRMQTAILREQLRSPGWDGLRAERTAIGLASSIDGVPVPHDAVLLDDGRALGHPVLLHSEPRGVNGRALIDRGVEPALAVYRALGSVMRRLADVGWPRFGSRPVDGLGFVARRETWAEELAWRLSVWTSLAEAQGTDLGPFSAEIEADLREEIANTAPPETSVLVHLDLRAENVFLDPETLQLSCVIHWTDASFGDPMLEWIQALQLPLPALNAVIEGYGVDRAREVLRDGVDRLATYHGIRTFARLGAAAQSHLGDGAFQRATRLERARAALAVDRHAYVRDRLDRALDGAEPSLSRPSPSPADVLRRRALERMRLIPEPGPAGCALTAAALACAELNAPAVGQRLLDALDRPIADAETETIPDRPAFLERLRSTASARSTLTRAIAAMGLTGVDALDHAVSDAVLRGLQSQIAGMAGHTGDRSARGQVVAALIDRDPEALAEAWDAFCPFPPAAEPAAPWPPDDWGPQGETDALLAVARLGLDAMPDPDLPVDRTLLWQVLSR